MSDYAALSLKSTTGMLTFDVDMPERAVPDTPALALLTDLAHGPRVSVYPDDGIDEAVELMKRAGVRMAFVVTNAGSITTPIGLVTASDLLGERPMQIAADSPMRRHELRVRDLMEPIERWHVIDMATARNARVGHIIETMRSTGKRHLIVIQQRQTGTVVRGVFSATRIERAIGAPIGDLNSPRSFADVEAALAPH